MGDRRLLPTGPDDPLFAGGLVAAVAAAFSALYLVIFPGVSDLVPGIGPAVLFILLVLNAFLVTAAVWQRTIRGVRSATWKRFAGTGLLIGLLSHLGLGTIVSTAFVMLDENGLLVTGVPSLGRLPELAAGWVGMSMFVGLYSIMFTLGVPILLSIGIGSVLGRSHGTGSDV